MQQRQVFTAPATSPELYGNPYPQPGGPPGPASGGLPNAFGSNFGFINDPTAQMGLQVGKTAVMAGQQYMEQNVNRYISVPALKHYFNVSNSYVVRKLLLVLFPWRHKPWTRSQSRMTTSSTDASGQMSQEQYSFNYLPPRDDLNSPDMYIPIMAFITYILLSTVLAGMRGSFRPELLGSTASTALGVVLFEIVVLKTAMYLLSISNESQLIDLVAYSGYKFVGVIVTLFLAELVTGGRGTNNWAGWVFFLYTWYANAFFLLRSLKYVLLPDSSNDPTLRAGASYTVARAQKQRRTYFLAIYAFLIQLSFMWVLTREEPASRTVVNKLSDSPLIVAAADGKGDDDTAADDQHSRLPWYRRPSIFLLLPSFFPFCLAFGGVIVPKQYLVLERICRDYLSDRALQDPGFQFTPVVPGGNNPQCRIPEVQSLVANFGLYQQLLAGLFAAVTAPHLGALSDRIGRKKVLVAASFGSVAMEVITILVGQFPESVSVWWILLGALLDGICGSFTASMALSFAYATDCTPPAQRAAAFGAFHATFFTGIAFGPLLASALMRAFDSVMIVFYLALAGHLFFLSFVAFVLPESLSKDRQQAARDNPKSWLQTLTAYNMFEPLWVLQPRGPGSSAALRRNLLLLAAIDTMMFGVAMGTMPIIIIYAQFRYGWDEIASSMFLSAVNICRVTTLGSDRLDLGIIRASTLFDLIGYIGYALSPTGAGMAASGLIAALGGIGSPTLQSSLTKHLPPSLTGQVLGASALLHALARVVAPLAFNLIYSRTVKIYAGIVFLCLGSIFVIVFILSWLLKPGIYLHEESDAADPTPGQDHPEPYTDREA
ncbi:hypothetical protein DV738_g1091, partial [Chaetothyriales sp. CBS 135597]